MKKFEKRDGLFLAGGVLLGTVGLKALTSKPAKKLYVQGVACGLRAKDSYQQIVEEAKSQVDDIVAEASYVAKKDDKAESCGCGCTDSAPAQA